MHNQIYVNLAVADLARSKAFFTHLGYRFHPQYTDDNAACLILGNNIQAMLLTQAFFQGFTTKPLVDAHASTEVLLCLACSSRDEVDRLVVKALEMGGSAPKPAQDHGFMYGHGFQDPDGHLWELVYMVPAEPLPSDEVTAEVNQVAAVSLPEVAAK